MRPLKVLKNDELCPKCERKLERWMLRRLHWLNKRNDFTIEYVHLCRNGESPMPSPEWPLFTESESESMDGHRSPPWAQWESPEDEEDEADDEDDDENEKNDDEDNEEKGEEAEEGAEKQSPEEKLLSGLWALLCSDWDEEVSEGEESFSTTEESMEVTPEEAGVPA
jgi:hypothetical protein